MGKIIDLINEWKYDKPFFSLEFFPPKTEEADRNFRRELRNFAELNPLWVDVTWGAGGSTSKSTLEICQACLDNGMVPNLHLTCTAVAGELIDKTLEQAKKMGIKNVLALRGDAPQTPAITPLTVTNSSGKPVPKTLMSTASTSFPLEGSSGPIQDQVISGPQYVRAVDLIKHIRKNFGDFFCIGVAGYPEGHPECANKDDDIRYLKEKLDAGADYVITQLFYVNDFFLNFVRKCREAGITAPIIPGIMPIISKESLKRFTTFCGTHVPPALLDQMDNLSTPGEVVDFGINVAIRDVADLWKQQITPGFHIYTMNRLTSVKRIIAPLGFSQKSVARWESPWCLSLNTTNQAPKPIFGRFPIPEGSIPDAEKIAMWGEYPLRKEDVVRVFYNYFRHHFSNCRLTGFPETKHGGRTLNEVTDLPWIGGPMGLADASVLPWLLTLSIVGCCPINWLAPMTNMSPTNPVFGYTGSKLSEGEDSSGQTINQLGYLEFFAPPNLWSALKKLLDEESGIFYGAGTFVPGDGDFNYEGVKVLSKLNENPFWTADKNSFLTWKDKAFYIWMSSWGNLYDRSAKLLMEEIQSTFLLVHIFVSEQQRLERVVQLAETAHHMTLELRSSVILNGEGSQVLRKQHSAESLGTDV